MSSVAETATVPSSANSSPKREGAAVVVGAGIAATSEFGPVFGPLHLQLSAGEFLTIVGPSGVGKTTLLRVLGGMRAPDGGSVVRPPGRVAWVAQERNVFPWMTVLRNAAFTLEIAGVGKTGREARAAQMLERLGLAGFENAWPHQLSAGMKQRVALARAFLGEPALLLMDEPFSSVDTARRASLQEELLALWDRTRVTVIFVTHEVEEAVFLSQRILVLGGRPATVRGEIAVDLPYPRPFGVTLTDAFLKIKRQVHAVLGAHTGGHAG